MKRSGKITVHSRHARRDRSLIWRRPHELFRGQWRSRVNPTSANQACSKNKSCIHHALLTNARSTRLGLFHGSESLRKCRAPVTRRTWPGVLPMVPLRCALAETAEWELKHADAYYTQIITITSFPARQDSIYLTSAAGPRKLGLDMGRCFGYHLHT